MKLSTRIGITIGIFYFVFVGILSLANAAPVTPPSGGGTGISTSTAANNTKNLYQVGVDANNHPIYGFQANGSGGGTTTTFNGVSGPTFTLASTTYLNIVASGTTFTFTNLGVTSTAGDWAGTWQGNNSTTFYLASNPSNFSSSTNGPSTSTFIGVFTAGGKIGGFLALTYTSSTGTLAAPTTTVSGSLGIGTTTPSQAIQVVGGNMMIDSGKELYLTNLTTGYGIGTGAGAGGVGIFLGGTNKIDMDQNKTSYGAAYVWETQGASFGFNVGSNARKMTILTSGNVGIGTQGPSSTLDVFGSVATLATTTATSTTLGSATLYVFNDPTVSTATLPLVSSTQNREYQIKSINTTTTIQTATSTDFIYALATSTTYVLTKGHSVILHNDSNYWQVISAYNGTN